MQILFCSSAKLNVNFFHNDETFALILSESGSGRKKSLLSIPIASDYILGGNDVDMTNIVGHIRAPDGTVEQCLLKKMCNGKLGSY